ncbi:nitrophenyl compound nitroreductase subunit ArsF family protein [Haloferula sp.]|uniref:nitrophenyl compound nitroreductase subunit ArsF family protein n=1 Tax=Haloferula sp. TaxID=2497595 RepID=UPI003C7115E5
MIAKQIIRGVLLIVVLGSLAIWANREYQKSHAEAVPAGTENLPAVTGDQVVMTYFISGTRCESCQKIEALTKETAEKDFAAELASGKLVFRVIDTDEPGYQHYTDDYQLTSKTVILSHRKGGRESEWADMSKVWDLLDDGPGFHHYLGTQIRAYLGS